MAAAGLWLAGCAHYQPAPVSPERFAAGFDARRLAAPEAGGAWRDSDLLAAALARAPAVIEARSGYRSSLAAAKAARVMPPTNLTLTAEYSRDAGGSSPWLVSGLFDIPLDRGVRRGARLEAADLAALQALYDYGEAAWSARTALRKAHIDRLAAAQQIVLAQQAVAVRHDRLARLDRRVAAGEDARSLALLAQGDLAAAQKRLNDARTLANQADLALAKAIGVSVGAVQGLNLEPLADVPPAPGDLTAWRAGAAAGRRDVLRAVADYDGAESALRLEVVRQYPDIRFGPGYTWERGVHKLPFNLSLALPPPDLNRASISAAEAKRTQAGRRLETIQAAVLAQVDQAAAAERAALDSLARLRAEDLALAQRSLRSARLSLSAGEADRTDLEAAQAGELDTALNVAEASRVAWNALADLEDALRRPSPAEAAVLDAAVKHAGDDT